jgi:hypothetical protein
VKSAVKDKQQHQENERKVMNNKFDELAKGMAQSVTRRAALKKFGVGLAGLALACFGLAKKAQADPRQPSLSACLPIGSPCSSNNQCCFRACSRGVCILRRWV